MWDMEPVQARQLFAVLMQMAGPQNVPIGSVADLEAPGPGGPISMRSYTPLGAADGPLPTLVFYHGGGFVIGDLDTHDGLCCLLANESGARVIAVDYRLAPEHKFPAAVDDAWAALAWIVANADELGVDPKRVAVGGDSAGANLTAVMAQMASAKSGPKLVLQMMFFPATQMGADTASMRANAEGYFLEKRTIDWFFANYLNASAEQSDLRASPLLARDFRGLPPAFLMTAGYDPLHDEGVAYGEKLRAAGVQVEAVDYPDLMHDFIYLQPVLPQAGDALRGAAAALKRAFNAE
jgi:acetyl esterase